MKILLCVIMLICLVFLGAIIYVYKKYALFLPGLLGLYDFPKVQKSTYYKENGEYCEVDEDEKMSFFMQHPVFEGYRHMFFNLEDAGLRGLAPIKYKYFLKIQGREDQFKASLEAFNYLLYLANNNQVKLISNIYPVEERKNCDYYTHLTGILYKGEKDKPFALVVPGGGFVSNVTDCEGYPLAMKLHQLGYSVFVLSYPVGKQLGSSNQEEQAQAATKMLTYVIQYLNEHRQQLSINMDDFAIFGFSAGGLMTTAYSFANYKDSCHKHHLPRPKVIFPMYGLDWNIKVYPEDVGLAVFSIVGKDDEFGFAKIEDKIPQIKKVLGEENVEIRIVEGLGHGFGIGNDTKVKNWLTDAIKFWEIHRN